MVTATYGLQNDLVLLRPYFESVDGYSCQLIGKGEVSINGIRVPVVERVCINQCMADVTDIPDVKVGDDVYVWEMDSMVNTLLQILLI